MVSQSESKSNAKSGATAVILPRQDAWLLHEALHPNTKPPDPAKFISALGKELAKVLTTANGGNRNEALKAHIHDHYPTEAGAILEAIVGADTNKPPPEPEPDPWQSRCFTLEDAYKPRGRLQYVVERLIRQQSLNIAYGAPGTLKTMLLMDLALCAASGVDWLPPLPGQECAAFNLEQSPVLWVDFDNGLRRTHERFEALARSRQLPVDIPLTYFVTPSPWLDMSSLDARDELGERILRYNAKLVFIDNFGLIRGRIDENSPGIAQVMGNLRWLTETTGTALTVIHHQRKTSLANARAGESLRGHSCIEASLDLALLIEREERSSDVAIKATKSRDIDIPPFAASFTASCNALTSELESAKFFRLAVRDASSDRAVDQAILEAVSDNKPCNQRAIIQCVKEVLPEIGINRIRSRVDRCEATGKITATKGKFGAKIYDIPR